VKVLEIYGRLRLRICEIFRGKTKALIVTAKYGHMRLNAEGFPEKSA